MTDRGGGASLLPCTPAVVAGSDDDGDPGQISSPTSQFILKPRLVGVDRREGWEVVGAERQVKRNLHSHVSVHIQAPVGGEWIGERFGRGRGLNGK